MWTSTFRVSRFNAVKRDYRQEQNVPDIQGCKSLLRARRFTQRGTIRRNGSSRLTSPGLASLFFCVSCRLYERTAMISVKSRFMANDGLHLRSILPLLPSPNFASEKFFSATSEMPPGEIPEYCAPHLIFMVQAGSDLHQTQGYIDGRRFTEPWPPGLLTFYPQGTRIRAEWKNQSRKAWLEIHEDLTAIDFTGEPLRRLPKLHRLSDKLIRDTVLLLSGCRTTPHTGEPLFRETLMTRLIAHLQQPPSSPDWALNLDRARVLTPFALKKARDYAYDHLSEPLTLEDWAKAMGLSSFYFVRGFRATTGLSPYQYVIDQRIQHARQLLEAGWAATEVAMHLCFSSSSHFSVIFKQRTGLSPTAWREFHLKRNSPIFQSVKAFDARNFYQPLRPS
jgi:AraC family transcriptional regulator